MSPTPEVGRIVHFGVMCPEKRWGGSGDLAKAKKLPFTADDSPVFITRATYSDELKEGHWSWPSSVMEELRMKLALRR